MTIHRSGLPHPAAGGTVSALVYNQLVLPGKPEARARFQIKGGQGVLKAGTIMGGITAAGDDLGKLVVCTAAANDGSQYPVAILPEDLDTGSADSMHSVYVEGTFNETALTYGTGHTANTVRLHLRTVGILLDAPIHSSKF